MSDLNKYRQHIQNKIDNIEVKIKNNTTKSLPIAFSNSKDGKKDFSLEEFKSKYIGILKAANIKEINNPENYNWKVRG